MNLLQILQAYGPQLTEAAEALKQNDPGPMLSLVPDFARAMAEEQRQRERRSKAAFIAKVAASLCGGAVETCETETEAAEMAARSVRLAALIVRESQRVAGDVDS